MIDDAGRLQRLGARSWILGFGPLARVISPPELVRQILDEADERLQYAR